MKSENPRKLVFLLTQSLESPSGLGRYFPLAKYLAQSGLQVTILALHPAYEQLAEKDFWREGVHVRYVAPMHVRKDGSKTLYYGPWELLKVSLRAFFRLYRAGREERPDLVFVGKAQPMNGLAGWLLARLHGKPLVQDCDDYEAESNHYSATWQKKLVRFFEDCLPRCADLVTCNTMFNIRRMAALGIAAEKMHYLPNGFDADRFKPVGAEDLSALRQSLMLEGYKAVLFVGSLSLANHPVDLLVRAFARVSREVPDAKLIIVGGGKDKAQLEGLATQLDLAERVLFTGRVDPATIAPYYQLADLSVDPAEDNPANCGRCPLKLFESWAMGTPFVTADVGDRRFLAGDPPALALCAPGDEDALSETLVRLLHNPQEARELARQGSRKTPEYSWQRISEDARALFRSILG